MAKKFFKIRKWAEENGYEITDIDPKYNFSNPTIEVRVPNLITFEIDERQSTIYQSIRGRKGNCAGLYLGDSKSRYSFHHLTQKDIINAMENKIKKYQ